MLRTIVIAWAAALMSCAFPSSASAATPVLRPPVYGTIERGFEQPQGPYAAGHRGVDFSAPPGAQVVAAAAGVVAFAGPVGSAVAVTISHDGGLETTYTSLAGVRVEVGQPVEAGTLIGAVGESHPGTGEGLHLGVKLNGSYVDPQLYLAVADVSDALHLAPVVWQPPDSGPTAFWGPLRGPGSFGSDAPDCEPVADPGPHPPPPDDNVVVEVAGIGSHTRGSMSAALYSHGAEALGFPTRDIHRYSYLGARGVFLHQPYSVTDSFEDLDLAARRIRDLLRRIARLYPGRDVDLVAHSQGGVVARTYLTRYASGRDVPRVEHLVTFSSPHAGAPFASNSTRLEGSWLGRQVLGAIDLARHLGAGIPDPRSTAVEELAPESPLMSSLARQDIEYGTRVLALAMPDDPVVPANRALWPGHYSRVVPPAFSINPHNAILTSDSARAIAYDFLRDGPPACPTSWDGLGPDLGGAIGTLEGHISTGVNVLRFVLGVP